MAGTGPTPIIDGSTPTTEYPTSRAIGVKLCSLTPSSLARTKALAPSQIPWKNLIKNLLKLEIIKL